jgi:hypothetical protein
MTDAVDKVGGRDRIGLPRPFYFVRALGLRDLSCFGDDLTLGICAKKRGKKRGDAWGVLRLLFLCETPTVRYAPTLISKRPHFRVAALRGKSLSKSFRSCAAFNVNRRV